MSLESNIVRIADSNDVIIEIGIEIVIVITSVIHSIPLEEGTCAVARLPHSRYVAERIDPQESRDAMMYPGMTVERNVFELT